MKFTRGEIFSSIIFFNICIAHILIEKRACKLCWCVIVRSSRLIFGQVCVRSEYSTALLLVTMNPLIPDCAVE